MRHLFRRCFSIFISLTAVAGVGAADAKKPAPTKPDETRWVFSLLPKSLQKNPRLDLTVITEMTEEGKKRPPVSPDKPAYFQAFSGGYHILGARTGSERTVPEAELTKLLTRSLATNGYLPASPPAHPPSLIVMYTWGSHNLLVEGDAENATLSAEAVARNLLDRAALVGGTKFATELKELFERANELNNSNRTAPPDPTGTVPDQQPMLGADQMAFMNPVEMFKRGSDKNEFLVDQAARDVYYVVASAYDYAAMQANRRVLLWRTRMTVAAQGVAEQESLPTLVLAAAPYFGKDMPEPEILSKRSVREGTVEVGTPTVVEPTNQSPAKSAPTR